MLSGLRTLHADTIEKALAVLLIDCNALSCNDKSLSLQDTRTCQKSIFIQKRWVISKIAERNYATEVNERANRELNYSKGNKYIKKQTNFAQLGNS